MKLLRFLTISVTALLIAGAQVAQALSFDNDVPKDIQSQVVADLGFMAQIQGSNQTKLHQQIYGNVQGQAYKTFFD